MHEAQSGMHPAPSIRDKHDYRQTVMCSVAKLPTDARK